MFDPSSPAAHPAHKLLVDVLFTLLATGLVIVAARLSAGFVAPAADQVLAFAAVAVAAAGAAIGAFSAHFVDESRLRWAAAAFALHALVVLPAAALSTPGNPADGPRVVGFVAMTAMLVCWIRPPRVPAWAPMVVAILGAVAALSALVWWPAPPGLLAGSGAQPLVFVLWSAVAGVVVIDGLRRAQPARWRLGLGLVVMAVAQLFRVADVPVPVVFAALRLLGLLIIVIGFAQLMTRALERVHEERFAHQEEQLTAAVAQERLAAASTERDHELRNGLAGLAGITHIVGSAPEHAPLREAVLAELGRLYELVDGEVAPTGEGSVPAVGGDAGAMPCSGAMPGAIDTDFCVVDPTPDGLVASGYEVGPTLDRLVQLRQATGLDVRLDAATGLSAVGDSAALAQIVTNLLANCARHAPGTPVWVRAFAEGDTAVIEVRDAGPGLRGYPSELFTRGVRDRDAGGLGLGLAISRELAEREGGRLELSNAVGLPGCVARLTLPLLCPAPVAHPTV